MRLQLNLRKISRINLIPLCTFKISLNYWNELSHYIWKVNKSLQVPSMDDDVIKSSRFWVLIQEKKVTSTPLESWLTAWIKVERSEWQWIIEKSQSFCKHKTFPLAVCNHKILSLKKKKASCSAFNWFYWESEGKMEWKHLRGLKIDIKLR